MNYRWLQASLALRLGKPFVHVLFGARQTGKTTLLRELLPHPALTFNLADPGGNAHCDSANRSRSAGVRTGGVPHCHATMAVLKSEDALRALIPRLDLVVQLPGYGFIVTAPGSDSDFVSRFFAPQVGVPEDPVTGSAHCTLVPYWSRPWAGSSSMLDGCRRAAASYGARTAASAL